ncbi:unnamed protein product [Clavelina lepadiformis]|uniref:Uncharacterized protein n=1 Tax=Clavelina lepadiformis TaxID=159417 RepID=A0ABP0FN49_CLALP
MAECAKRAPRGISNKLSGLLVNAQEKTSRTAETLCVWNFEFPVFSCFFLAQKRKEDQWDPIRSGSGARFISSNQQGRSTFGSAVIGGAFPALVESLRFTSSHSKLKFLNLGLHSLRILEVFQLRGVPLLSFR